MKNTLLKFTFALIVLLVVVPLGCAHQSAATRQAVSKLQSQGAIAVARATTQGAVKLQNAKDANAVSKENGADAPATHPIAATNNTEAELHKPLLILTILSFVLYAAAFGLSFTSFKLFTPFIPALRMSFLLFLVSLFTLPFMPLAIFAIIGSALGLFVYEMIRAKGNVKVAIEDEEADLGFATATSTTTTTTVSAATSPVPPMTAGAAVASQISLSTPVVTGTIPGPKPALSPTELYNAIANTAAKM